MQANNHIKTTAEGRFFVVRGPSGIYGKKPRCRVKRVVISFPTMVKLSKEKPK
jgi:hypothetical protein